MSIVLIGFGIKTILKLAGNKNKKLNIAFVCLLILPNAVKNNEKIFHSKLLLIIRLFIASIRRV